MKMSYMRKDMSEKKNPLAEVVKRWVRFAMEDEEVVFVESDSLWNMLDGIDPTIKQWFRGSPDRMRRMVRCGIAEADAAAVAAGLSDQGLKVFYTTTPWLLERAYNIVAYSICIDRHNVTLVGRGVGIGGGPTHQNMRHIAWSLPIPNLICMSAADAVEAVKIAEFAYKYNGPKFFVAPTAPTSTIFDESYQFKVGKAPTVREGKDATIIVCDEWVYKGILAAEQLSKEGIDARVIDMSTLKPIDKETIIKAAKETGAIVTAESTSIHCGLGSAVAAVLVENYPVPMKRLALNDLFTQADVSRKAMMEAYYHQTPEDLANVVKETIARK